MKHHHRSVILLIALASSGFILFAPNPAIAQQLQHQQLLTPTATATGPVVGAGNILAAKILNKHTIDQGNNRDAVVNNHLVNMGAQHQPSNGPRDVMQHQRPITTGADYMKAANQLLLDLRQEFITRSFKFDEHFRNLLSTSKRGLHLMFTSTYGIMYEKNTEIFTEMYGSLEQYYDNGQVNLTKSMDEFFANLYKRVFQVYNSNKQFTNQYLDCVSDRLTEMKPFKDVPDKLIKSIRYTFVAARTFLKSLNEGIDVIKNVISLGQSPQCTNLINDKLIKNQQALAGNKQPPCLPFCEQVMARCIGKDNLDQMNEKWRAYVVSLSELALKLSNSYNIETTIEPLDVQISEAIMNFQENAPNITERVYKICGGPVNEPSPVISSPRHVARLPTNRLARRSANPIGSYDYHRKPAPQLSRQSNLNENRYKVTGFESLAHELSHRTLDQNLARAEQKSSILIDEIKKFASSSKVFWSSLPNSVCTSVLGSNSSATNGFALPYKKQSPNCYSEHFSITDINSDIRYKTEILKQATHLDVVRSKIDDALNGIEVDWASLEQQQQQHQQQQKPPTVSNQIQVIGGGSRPPQPISMFTSSTTAVPADPVTDDEDEEYDPVESGSGDDDNCSEEDPEGCEQNQDHDLDTTESPAEDDGSSTTPPIEITSMIPEPIDDNGIDKPSIPSNPDPNDLVLITAPNQAGFQKSGQTSDKLVINFGGYVMLSLIMSVALLFVTNFSTRSRTISMVRTI